jgi:hypothetical protein
MVYGEIKLTDSSSLRSSSPRCARHTGPVQGFLWRRRRRTPTAPHLFSAARAPLRPAALHPGSALPVQAPVPFLSALGPPHTALISGVWRPAARLLSSAHASRCSRARSPLQPPLRMHHALERASHRREVKTLLKVHAHAVETSQPALAGDRRGLAGSLAGGSPTRW